MILIKQKKEKGNRGRKMGNKLARQAIIATSEEKKLNIHQLDFNFTYYFLL